MAFFRIRTHTSAADTEIGDTGWTVPGAGGFIDIDETEEAKNAQASEDLRFLLVDDAFGAGASTLVLVEMPAATDVAQADALALLNTVLLPGAGPYSIFVRDAAGDPPADAGVTAVQHKALAQLIHFVDDGPAAGFGAGPYFREVLPDGAPFPTSEVWYTSSAKTDKIVSLDITRNVAQCPTAEVWKVYDTDGSTVLATLTDTITYTNAVFESSRSRAVS